MSKHLIVLAYNAGLIIGTVWLVGWHGWSGWWFVLTLGLMVRWAKADDA